MKENLGRGGDERRIASSNDEPVSDAGRRMYYMYSLQVTLRANVRARPDHPLCSFCKISHRPPLEFRKYLSFFCLPKKVANGTIGFPRRVASSKITSLDD